MTDTPQSNTDIAEYRLAVERHLADLPASIREDLLNGLEEHLAEVAADLEPGVPLAHLLGGPEAYARELRETAEIPKERAGDRFWRSMWRMADPSLAWARGAADRFTGSAGVGEAGEFGRTLRPAWWVLRGLIAAALVAHVFVFGDEILRRAVLSVGAFGFLFVVAIALAFVWLSLKLGVRSQEWSRRNRRLTAAGGIALAAVGALSFSWVADGFVFRWNSPVMHAMTENEPDDGVSDVHVYDENGELLTGVYLFDQDGSPLYLGEPWSCDDGHANNPFEQGEREDGTPGESTSAAEPPLDEGRYGYRYPLCMPVEEDAAERPSPEPTDEEPTAAEEGAETPTEAPATPDE
ncbi:MAG TPA: hypothetical protein VFU12_07880 [Glycomyces sp.]|nr:hypothetical protein [Glycomyces sp.]